MRIKELTMSEDGFRIVTEADNGRLRETLMGYDEDGVAFIRWGDVEPEQELETFTAYDGYGNPVMTHTVAKAEEKPETPVVEWLNLTFPEAFNLHRSGKWEIEYFAPKLGWRPFNGHRVMPDGTEFRARPKPEALS